MKQRVRKVFALLMGICIISGACMEVKADDGIEKGYTYNYDYWSDIQFSPDAYMVKGVYTAVELGLDKRFSSAEGMYVRDNMIYICDTGNNRILLIERTPADEFQVRQVVEEFSGETDIRTFASPTDICVTPDGYYFICDKGNHRILKLDSEWNYVMEFLKPDDSTLSQDTDFLPDKLEVDDVGRVFCIADNVNKGMIKYEPDGTFSGFYGASEVKYDWTDYVWKKLATKAQRSAMESFVPTEYDNLYRDAEGFIYACTTNVRGSDLDSGADKPIRRLNMLGKNILIENGNFNIIGDVTWDNAGGYKGPSLIADITALDSGIYFAMDRVRGHIFGYDEQGNMLYAFGGSGNMDGYFRLPAALEHMGNDLIVLDSQDASFTVFTPTEYGNLIYKAMAEYDAGDYMASGSTWEQVKILNGNYDLAYIGIGRALMRQGEYKEAMEYFRLKWDTEHYSKAFKQYRKEWVEEHIGWIFLAVFLLFILPMVVGRIKKIKYEIDTAQIFKD